MNSLIKSVFHHHGIEEVGCIPFSEAVVLRPNLMPENIQSVIMVLAPYDTKETYSDGVSRYAHISDYHTFFSRLFSAVIPELTSSFPGETFHGFADHSPINEKLAASKAGLGVIGNNSLLINPRYGSYVFIGGILTSLQTDCRVSEVSCCIGCNKCMEACPTSAIPQEHSIDQNRCLSSISQKRHLTDDEYILLRRHHVAWGCDKCQDVCPMNRSREITAIPYFLDHRHGTFLSGDVSSLSDEDFMKYAFSWRGRNRIVNNLRNLEGDKPLTLTDELILSGRSLK